MKITIKYLFNKLLLCLLFSSILISCFGCAAKINDISFNDAKKSIDVGEQIVIVYSVDPSDIDVSDVSINNSSEDILRNIHDNVYEGISQGIATLTLVHDGKEYGKCNVEVNNVELQSLKVVNDEVNVGIGNSYIPDVLFYPSNTTNKKYTLSSSDEQIAKISNNEIIGISEGCVDVAIIGDNNITTSFIVNVVPVIANNIEIVSPTNIRIGDETNLSIKWNPDNVTYKNVSWKTNNSSIAKIDKSGRLYALDDGTVTITAIESSNNIETSKQITINPISISNIFVSTKKDEIYKGDGIQINVDYSPSNATYKKVSYKSNDEDILSVSKNGYVSAIGVGVASIIVSTDNGISKKIEITVKEKPVQQTTVTKQTTSSDINTNSNYETYILNTNTKKFHRTSCGDVKKIKDANKQTFTGSRSDVINKGYTACKHCNP